MEVRKFRFFPQFNVNTYFDYEVAINHQPEWALASSILLFQAIWLCFGLCASRRFGWISRTLGTLSNYILYLMLAYTITCITFFSIFLLKRGMHNICEGWQHLRVFFNPSIHALTVISSVIFGRMMRNLLKLYVHPSYIAWKEISL